MQRRTPGVDSEFQNAVIGLGCMVLLFKLAVLAAVVYVAIYAINAFS